MNYLVTYADPNGGSTRETTIAAARYERHENPREVVFFADDDTEVAAILNYYAVVPAPQDAPAGD